MSRRAVYAHDWAVHRPLFSPSEDGHPKVPSAHGKRLNLVEVAVEHDSEVGKSTSSLFAHHLDLRIKLLADMKTGDGRE
jgi:hypothetical protein